MFKSNPLLMQGDFANKQVIETKGNLHKKAKEAQYKNFQHKTRKLDIIEIHKKDFANKQVIETKGNLHKKAKEAQYKNFQHKTRKLDIIEIHKNTFPSIIVTFSIMHKLNNITITRAIITMITYSN